MTFSPDNRLIASLSHGGVLLWEAGTGRQLARLSATDPKFVRFHPQGDALIVSSLNQINRWPLQRKDADTYELGPPELLFSGRGWQDVAFDQQGTRLLAANPTRSLAMLTNWVTRAPAIIFEPHESAFAAALSPDGRWAATGSSSTKEVCVWDTTTGQKVHRFHDGQNWQVAFSPDGRWLAHSEKIVCSGKQVRGSPARSYNCPRKTPLSGPPLSRRTAAASPLCSTNAKSTFSRCRKRSC